MKKSLRSVVAVLLAVIMTAGLCMSAMAGDEPAYEHYVSLGDSLSAGYGEEHFPRQDETTLVTSAAAPCRTVARELGIEDLYGATFSGCRSTELLSFLTGEPIYDEYNSGDGEYAYRMELIMARSEEGQAKVRNADLITLTFGANDIISYALSVTQLVGYGKEITAEGVSDFVEALWKGYSNFCTYGPRLLRQIREMAPKADVVLAGVFDPLRDTTLTDGTLLPIGTALTAITALLNEKYRTMAEENGAIYADISDCDNWFNGCEDGPDSLLSGMDRMLLYVHPTAEGYAYIGRQMVNALRQQDQKVTTDIRLDLQSVKAKSVTSVLVNGVAVKSFKVTGTYSIEIPCSNKLAATVTVIAREGRTVKTTVWYVRWIPGTGYQPTAIAKNGDVAQSGISAAQKVAGNVTSVVKSITSIFKK